MCSISEIAFTGLTRRSQGAMAPRTRLRAYGAMPTGQRVADLAWNDGPMVHSPKMKNMDIWRRPGSGWTQ
jgi:hypothetical protein